MNKSDLCADPEARAREARAIARGAPVILASAAMGDVSRIEEYLAPGRTIALLGSSGAGKSTIVNRLLGEDRQRTAAVLDADSRGRHTTTSRELVLLPGGGALIDTPGMRELQLWAGEEALDQAFDDIAFLASGCRFRNCSHEAEQGCAVEAAITEGRLDGGRWLSYRKLLGEVRRHERLTDHRARLQEKQRVKRIHKAMRRHYRERG